MKRMVACALATGTLLAPGCAPTPVDIELVFPSQETFLFAEFAELTVHALEPTDLGACPRLLDEALAGSGSAPVLDAGAESVCRYRSGAVRFDSIPAGPHGYVVLVRDASNRVLLTGCRVAEAYEGAPAIDIALFPTATYSMVTSGMTPPFPNEDAKCALTTP